MSIPPLSFAANSCFTLGRDNGIDVLIVLVGLEGCERFLRFLVEHLAGPRKFHRPINKRHHRRAERFSKLGEFVFHLSVETADELFALPTHTSPKFGAVATACVERCRGRHVRVQRSARQAARKGGSESRSSICLSRIESAASTLLALSNSKGDALRAEESTISSVTNKSVRIPIAHPTLSLVSLARISGPVCLETGELAQVWLVTGVLAVWGARLSKRALRRVTRCWQQPEILGH
jgi:hypothetical protein